MSQNVIGIMGASLGTRNRGVSALGASVIKLFTLAAPHAQPLMLVGNKDARPFELQTLRGRETIPVANFRMSPKARFSEHIAVITALGAAYRLLPFRWARQLICRMCPWIKTVRDAAIVCDIRGGDSFSDIYGVRGLILSSLPIMTVIWVRGSIALLPQTYGPFRHPLSRLLARYILRHASTILSRDLEGIECVAGLVGNQAQPIFCPDVAFTLDPILPQSPQITPPLNSSTPLLIGLNVNGLVYNGGYTRQNMFGLKLDYRSFVEDLVQELLRKHAAEILLVPHTFAPHGDVESDPEACRRVLDTVPIEWRHRVHLVTADYDQSEIKGIIGQCNFFIGSRMHACIAALSQGIPTIGIAYSKKFSGVFSSVGVADCVIDARSTDAEDALALINLKIERRDELRRKLPQDVARTKDLIHSTICALTQTHVATK